VSADDPKISFVRRIAGRVSLYTLSLVAAGSIRGLAVLFIVRFVPPAAYGTYVALWVILFGVQSGGDLGLGAAALRYAPECADEEERRSLFATMLTTRAVAGAVLSGLVIVFSEPLARFATGSEGNARALVFLAASRPFAMLFDALSDELRARDRMDRVALLVVLGAVLVQSLTIVFVVVVGQRLMGLVWGRAVGDLLACAVAFAVCFRFVRGRPSRAELVKLVRFGWPLGVMYVVGMTRVLDRTMIRSLVSLDDVALYELANRLVGPIGLSNVALAKVFEPLVYRHATSHETPGHVDLFFRSYVSAFAVAAMALSLFAPEAITLLAPVAYHGTARILPALMFCAVAEGTNHAAGIGADIAKRTGVWAVTAVLSITIGFSVGWALLLRLGTPGVGLGWVAGASATTVYAYIVARRLSGFVLPVASALAVIIAGALLATAAAWSPWPLLARVALLAAYTLVTLRVLRPRWSSLKAMW
jgi:O-antigen/teichoic acid export membrane protein